MIFSQSRHQANAIISTGHKRWNFSATYMSNEERSSERRVGNCMRRELLNQPSLIFSASVVSGHEPIARLRGVLSRRVLKGALTGHHAIWQTQCPRNRSLKTCFQPYCFEDISSMFSKR